MPIKQVIEKGKFPVKIYTHELDSEAWTQLEHLSHFPFIHSHIAVMPDAHGGIGSTIGSVIPTVGAIIPAAVGVDIGCFIGNTRIPLFNGAESTLKALAEKEEEQWIYAIDKQGKITGAKARAKLTRKNATLMKVILDNHAEIICTPDHQFLLHNGNWCESKDLRAETALMPLKDNTKVKYVEYLEKQEDVYCLTVPEYGNFALSAGVFVHNCGMNAVRLSLNAHRLPDNLRKIRLAIEEAVPVGFDMHKTIQAHHSTIKNLDTILDKIIGKHPVINKMIKRPYDTWTQQLGTLGGGNHFIEICLDEHDNVWIMLHSGSRGIGNTIGRYFIELAKKDMEQHIKQLPHRDLAYFTEGAQHFNDYVEAVHWAQEYAFFNRHEMMRLILEALRKELPHFEVTKEAINCHHNYVAIEEHFGKQVYLTRKGAIRAGEGELGIIPGSMGAKSFIVKGKGNPESFCSCSHGAGRTMSRTAAKRHFSVDDLIQQTQGIECRKDGNILDEIPQAYKDIDVVMKNQSDLVEIVHTLRQIINVKG